MIGKYRANEATPFRCGVSAFTLPKGAAVEVTQVDIENQKVLMKVSSTDMDWFSMRFLRLNFTKE